MFPRNRLENSSQDTDLLAALTLPFLLELVFHHSFIHPSFAQTGAPETPIRCGINTITPPPRSMTLQTGVGVSPGASALGIHPYGYDANAST